MNFMMSNNDYLNLTYYAGYSNKPTAGLALLNLFKYQLATVIDEDGNLFDKIIGEKTKAYKAFLENSYDGSNVIILVVRSPHWVSFVADVLSKHPDLTEEDLQALAYSGVKSLT